MERIEKTIEVHVPVHVAYNQWTQFEEFPEFMEGIREVHQKDDRHVHWVAEIGGKHKEWDAEITEQVPDRRIAWHSTSGARNDGVVEFSPVSDDDTRITVHIDYEAEGVVENVGDFFGATSNRVEGDLKRFKSFIESRGRETGAWRGRINEGQARDKDTAARLDPAFRADFDQRFAAQGGRYEEYAPAYYHGCDIRRRYGTAGWADVEVDARREWESQQPGTWERFKDAVRRGWESL